MTFVGWILKLLELLHIRKRHQIASIGIRFSPPTPKE